MIRKMLAKDVFDIVHQLQQINERATALARARDFEELQTVLTDVEYRVSLLGNCVGALRYRLAVHAVPGGQKSA